LLSAVARGHDDALAELYWRYVNRVSVRLASRLDDRRDTEDVTRAVFGRLFDELPRYRAEDGAFTAFVDSVVDIVVADRSDAATPQIRSARARARARHRDEASRGRPRDLDQLQHLGAR
jgi:DNA-directed RNA polymerase specialized sigma24 family protein